MLMILPRPAAASGNNGLCQPHCHQIDLDGFCHAVFSFQKRAEMRVSRRIIDQDVDAFISV
jgi:hypothetical protein